MLPLWAPSITPSATSCRPPSVAPSSPSVIPSTTPCIVPLCHHLCHPLCHPLSPPLPPPMSPPSLCHHLCLSPPPPPPTLLLLLPPPLSPPLPPPILPISVASSATPMRPRLLHPMPPPLPPSPCRPLLSVTPPARLRDQRVGEPARPWPLYIDDDLCAGVSHLLALVTVHNLSAGRRVLPRLRRHRRPHRLRLLTHPLVAVTCATWHPRLKTKINFFHKTKKPAFYIISVFSDFFNIFLFFSPFRC